MYAAYYGHETIAAILLDHNASVNLVNSMGYNALYYAQSSSNENIVQMLENNGARPLF